MRSKLSCTSGTLSSSGGFLSGMSSKHGRRAAPKNDRIAPTREDTRAAELPMPVFATITAPSTVSRGDRQSSAIETPPHLLETCRVVRCRRAPKVSLTETQQGHQPLFYFTSSPSHEHTRGCSFHTILQTSIRLCLLVRTPCHTVGAAHRLALLLEHAVVALQWS